MAAAVDMKQRSPRVSVILPSALGNQDLDPELYPYNRGSTE